MAFKTMIIDGDTNTVLEVREVRRYDISQETFNQFEKEFGKKVVFAASNSAYGKGYNVFILEKTEQEQHWAYETDLALTKVYSRLSVLDNGEYAFKLHWIYKWEEGKSIAK